MQIYQLDKKTKIAEILKIINENENLQDFTEEMIQNRQKLILDKFVENLRKNNLLQ